MADKMFFYGIKIINARKVSVTNKPMFTVKTLRGFYHIEIGGQAAVELQVSLIIRNFGKTKIHNISIQFLGIREDYHQKILEMNSNADLNTTHDEYGNTFHEIFIPFIKPKQELRIIVNYKLKVRPIFFKPPYYYPDLKSFIKDQPFQKKSHELFSLANKLRSNDAYVTIKNIVNFVISNITYERNYRRVGAINTLERKRGSCLGFSDLVTTLLRCVNIPARVVRGLYMTEPHAWVEVYVEPYGWIPIDPVAGIIGAIGVPWISYYGEKNNHI